MRNDTWKISCPVRLLSRAGRFEHFADTIVAGPAKVGVPGGGINKWFRPGKANKLIRHPPNCRAALLRSYRNSGDNLCWSLSPHRFDCRLHGQAGANSAVNEDNCLACQIDRRAPAAANLLAMIQLCDGVGDEVFNRS